MSEWQKNFFIGNWSNSFWKRKMNDSMLFFEGNRDVLLVGFDSEFGNNTSKNWRPWGAEFSQQEDISYLGFSQIVPNWYLSPWFEEQLSFLKSESFFEPFSRVLFAGHSMGGYGALRYSRKVLGSYVAAFSPQISLEPKRIDFDDRYNQATRLEWRGADTDVSAVDYETDRSWVFYDPYVAEDRTHAERLAASGTRSLRTYHSGHGSLAFLRKIGIGEEVLSAMCFEHLGEEDFYRLFRHRRTTPWFRKSLENYFSARGRNGMINRLNSALKLLDQEFAVSPYQPSAKAIP